MQDKLKELNKELVQILNELEEDYIECNKKPIYEFADLVPEDTNLSSVILADGPTKIKHSKRIKFQNNTSDRINGGEWIPVTISDDPQIPKSINIKLKISEKELSRIKNWVILNKDILLAYGNGEITTKKLYQQIKPLEDQHENK